MLPDKKIVEGIASHDSTVLNQVYREILPCVESFVVQNGGNEEQALDVFQDAMMIIYDKICKGTFSLQCKFSTYLYAVCKKVWIQEHKKQISRLKKLNEIAVVAEKEARYAQEGTDEMMELFHKHFNLLGKGCQKMLRLYFNGATIEDIREFMGFRTVHQASDKKYRCKKALIESIRNDPKFRKFRHG
jgi:RNA polymerase sigma factor (sigma-70 family)